MALRVLLADESSTIKKVMQLALQDFGIEVKSVPIGLDVLQVARSFQPDIIFADVLLSKRNGYEVSAEIKADSVLKKTPVVLMWSGFMELDEAKARSSGAEKRLEKPFDADHLRSLVKELVPRLGENKISDYLTFPDLPEIVETPAEPPPFQPKAPKAPAPEAPVGFEGLENFQLSPDESVDLAEINSEQSGSFQAPEGMLPPAPKAKPAPVFSAPTPQPSQPKEKSEPPPFSFESEDRDLEDPDEFQQVPLPGSKTKNAFEQRESEDWRTGALEQFRVAPQGVSPTDAFDNPDGLMEVSDASIAMTDGVEDVSIEDLEDLTISHRGGGQPKPKAPPPAAAAQAPVRQAPLPKGDLMIDPIRVEEILREQVRDVLESIAWKIIPDIAERVVREEVQRLLKEAERLS